MPTFTKSNGSATATLELTWLALTHMIQRRHIIGLLVKWAIQRGSLIQISQNVITGWLIGWWLVFVDVTLLCHVLVTPLFAPTPVRPHPFALPRQDLSRCVLACFPWHDPQRPFVFFATPSRSNPPLYSLSLPPFHPSCIKPDHSHLLGTDTEPFLHVFAKKIYTRVFYSNAFQNSKGNTVHAKNRYFLGVACRVFHL